MSDFLMYELVIWILRLQKMDKHINDPLIVKD